MVVGVWELVGGYGGEGVMEFLVGKLWGGGWVWGFWVVKSRVLVGEVNGFLDSGGLLGGYGRGCGGGWDGERGVGDDVGVLGRELVVWGYGFRVIGVE